MPDFDAFYEGLRTSAQLPTTSQPTPGDFLAVYEPLVADLAEREKARKAGATEQESQLGSLLGFFRERGMKVQGVDPAVDIARRATEKGIETIADFFTDKVGEDRGFPVVAPPPPR